MPDSLAEGVWGRAPGPESDVAMSTRIRLARNVAGYRFPRKLSTAERQSLDERIREGLDLAQIGAQPVYRELSDMPAVDRIAYTEKHMISRELANGSGRRGFLWDDANLVSVMVLEEDHLRLQVLRPGLDLDGAFEFAMGIDGRVERQLPYAFHGRFGYLTACPTNAGTGLRVSVMLHLPGLVQSGQIPKVFVAAAKTGLTVRGFHGEGTKSLGDFFQVSNQRTLGQSETDILASVVRLVPKIIAWERGVRTVLMETDRMALTDKVWRSLGILRYARRLTSAEAMEHLSAVRLGVLSGLITGVSLPDVNNLFVVLQPAHLQILKGRPLETLERDETRAALARERLKAENN
ncbi:MAG: hypothetical protein RIS21_1295 [Planctomycetota bacterium]